MILSVLFKPTVRIGKYTVDTYWITSLVGCAAMICAGCVNISSILSAFTANTAINPIKILILFICMTTLSVFLDAVGFFAYLASKTLGMAGKSQMRLFLYLYFTVSILTVFTSNDIIVLTFTPFICYFAKHANIDPLPYLIGEFVAANTWSMALIIGNPTNIYLSTACGVGFGEYMKMMLLPTVAAGTTALAVLLLLFGKKLREPIAPSKTDAVIKDKTYLIIGLAHLSLCTVFLAVGSYINAEMWLVSLFFTISLFFCVSIVSLKRRKPADELVYCVKKAPWQLIPFVLSMFVMILGLQNSGVTEAISAILGSEGTVFKYGITSFLAANLINNIPMSVLFSSVIDPLSEGARTGAVYASVIGSNVCAFFTPIGALAGMMWSGMLKKQHIKFTYKDFVKYGEAVSIPTVIAALCILQLEI